MSNRKESFNQMLRRFTELSNPEREAEKLLNHWKEQTRRLRAQERALKR